MSPVLRASRPTTHVPGSGLQSGPPTLFFCCDILQRDSRGSSLVAGTPNPRTQLHLVFCHLWRCTVNESCLLCCTKGYRESLLRSLLLGGLPGCHFLRSLPGLPCLLSHLQLALCTLGTLQLYSAALSPPFPGSGSVLALPPHSVFSEPFCGMKATRAGAQDLCRLRRGALRLSLCCLVLQLFPCHLLMSRDKICPHH